MRKVSYRVSDSFVTLRVLEWEEDHSRLNSNLDARWSLFGPDGNTVMIVRQDHVGSLIPGHQWTFNFQHACDVARALALFNKRKNVMQLDKQGVLY
jgi:hypothetical protein